jgi:hypothetical protein
MGWCFDTGVSRVSVLRASCLILQKGISRFTNWTVASLNEAVAALLEELPEDIQASFFVLQSRLRARGGADSKALGESSGKADLGDAVEGTERDCACGLCDSY